MLNKENYFKLPIEFLTDKKEISNEIKNDLELIKKKETTFKMSPLKYTTYSNYRTFS